MEPTVLVTGAASGIGRATVEQFRQAGWHVLATDVDEEGLRSLPSKVRTESMDVTDPQAVRDGVGGLSDGVDGLDCVVNNAGYATTGPVEELGGEQLRKQLAVLVHGPHSVLRETLPLLRARDGTAVTVTSVLGRVAFPGAGAYCAGKFAAAALGDALRMELDDVDVVLVEPAWVDTEFADRADPDAGAGDRSERYEWVYRGYEDGGPLAGGPLSVPPERVAETIHRAAESSDPDSRYPVGWQARMVLAGRYLPDSVADRIRRGVLRAFAWA
jgi:NAD(P)-dependent dehydrogenase (short-subunit alcohol dehydrogenase family)